MKTNVLHGSLSKDQQGNYTMWFPVDETQKVHIKIPKTKVVKVEEDMKTGLMSMIEYDAE